MLFDFALFYVFIFFYYVFLNYIHFIVVDMHFYAILVMKRNENQYLYL